MWAQLSVISGFALGFLMGYIIRKVPKPLPYNYICFKPKCTFKASASNLNTLQIVQTEHENYHERKDHA